MCENALHRVWISQTWHSIKISPLLNANQYRWAESIQLNRAEIHSSYPSIVQSPLRKLVEIRSTNSQSSVILRESTDRARNRAQWTIKIWHQLVQSRTGQTFSITIAVRSTDRAQKIFLVHKSRLWSMMILTDDTRNRNSQWESAARMDFIMFSANRIVQRVVHRLVVRERIPFSGYLGSARLSRNSRRWSGASQRYSVKVF